MVQNPNKTKTKKKINARHYLENQLSAVCIRWVDYAETVTMPMRLNSYSKGLQKWGRGMAHVPLLPTIVKFPSLILKIQSSTVPLFLKRTLSTCSLIPPDLWKILEVISA